jgi:hypothetical protein
LKIRELFTIPEGARVTEKLFGKVLLSSICSILLCMACLVSTTWAWFTAGMDNRENEIQIASVTAEITVKNAADNSPIDTRSAEGAYILQAGTYHIDICLKNTATGPDDLNRQPRDVYAVMTVTYSGKSESYYITFAGTPEQTKQLRILQTGSESATVSFSVSWVQPASAAPAGSDPIPIGEPTSGS